MDVHKDNITACSMTPEGKEIQTFSTKTLFSWWTGLNSMNVRMLQWIVRASTGSLLLTY
jgi:hypothetical protein